MTIKPHASLGGRIRALFGRKAAEPEPAAETPELDGLSAAAEAAYAAGDLDTAERRYKDVLAIDRMHAGAIRRLGAINQTRGNLVQAIRYLKEAQIRGGNDRTLAFDLGRALADSAQYDAAVEQLTAGLRLAPDDDSLLLMLATTYLMMGDDAKSLATLERAAALYKNSPAVLFVQGMYHHARDEIGAAEACYAEALKLDPDDMRSSSYLGVIYGRQRKTAAAIRLIDRALAADPHNINHLCSKAHILLASGDFAEGLRLYEYGLFSPKWRQNNLIVGRRVWNGSPMPDQTLLILHEQGLGDSIHFVRYAQLCRDKVKRILLYCPPALVSLFKNCDYIDEVVADLNGVAFDAQISMLSLPHRFGTTLAAVPAAVPYLTVSKDRREKWRAKLPPSDGKLRVGLVWSGSSFKGSERGAGRAARRNMTLAQLLPLFDCADVTFCNLQLDPAEAARIDELGLRDRFIDPMPDVADMEDTAAIITALDLVISVDTSVAHLAGALGQPVWILSRYDADWRWLHNRPDSPWYPTARVFGQDKEGDWDAVVKNVQTALRDFVAAGKARS